jgi:hypothetical protein
MVERTLGEHDSRWSQLLANAIVAEFKLVMPRLRENRGAIHQLLSISLKLRILVLIPVSTMPYVVIVENYS